MTTKAAALVTFLLAVDVHAPPTAVRVGQVDPRRLPAGALSRTRRAPPPIEGDTFEIVFSLLCVMIFTLAVW